MSLYNMMFGKNPASEAILATLGLTTADVGRFRDCWVEKADNGDVRVAVYTRNGGGNRSWHDDLEIENDEGPGCDCTGCVTRFRLPSHSNYIYDVDDDFDSTYATFYFSLPEKYADDLTAIALDERRDPSTEWLALIDALQTAPVKEQADA